MRPRSFRGRRACTHLCLFITSHKQTNNSPREHEAEALGFLVVGAGGTEAPLGDLFEPSEPGGDQSEEGGVTFALEEQEAGDFFFHAEFAPVGEALVGGAAEGVLGAEGDEFLVFHF